MFLLIVVIFTVISLTLYLLSERFNESYWKKRSVKFHPSNRFLGPFWEYLRGDATIFEILNDIYKKYPNEPAVGLGAFFQPTLYVRDPDNIQHILQDQSKMFSDKGLKFSKDDQLTDNLIFMNGTRWKLMRQSLSPLFTTAKLKKMFYIMDKSSINFLNEMKRNPQKLKGNAYETLNEFCLTAISNAVFGIDTKIGPDSPLMKVVRDSSNIGGFKLIVVSILHPLAKLLKLNFFKQYEDFFIGTIKKVLQQRQLDETAKRHDFPEMCVNLQKKGVMKDIASGYEMEPTDELMAAQAFFFFTAGVEPCATAMFAALIELGKHPDILKRVHEEIDDAFENNNGELTADIISELQYLDKVVNEGMRMYPPVGSMTRTCTQDTILPVGNIRVAKGTKLFTPLYEIHHDAKYYPDPEVFDPERFGDFKISGSAVFMPFGKGNRLCIGARYAMLQIKTGIVYLLRHFAVKTMVGEGGVKFDKSNLLARIQNVDIEFIPRDLIKT